MISGNVESPLAESQRRRTLKPSLAVRLLLSLIRLYQRYLSPFLGGQCRFVPSCSRYAFACIEGHGALRGSLLSVVRLCKCHPLHPGGHDPPPPRPGGDFSPVQTEGNQVRD